MTLSHLYHKLFTKNLLVEIFSSINLPTIFTSFISIQKDEALSQALDITKYTK